MEKSKKIKITLGLFYLIVVSSFLYFFFSKFTIAELTSYEFIKDNREYFFNLKKSNLILLSFIFVASTALWIFMAGFSSPICLLAGFIFGKWLGFVLVALGSSIGATFLYAFSNYFLKDLVRNRFYNKLKSLEKKFKKSEFGYLFLYRIIGGIPFAISNVLPCIFNVKISNFFWATLLGIAPQLFIIVSLGSGVEKVIEQNIEAPKIIDLIYSPDIYLPILAFIGVAFLTIVTRKRFYKD